VIAIGIKRKFYPPAGEASEHEVIVDFNLSLNENEFVCLVGPSGCGKTTLLNIVAGLDKDYQGEIQFKESRNQPKTGYVFQSPRLLPWRTLRENIELVLPESGDKAVIDGLLEMMQLKPFQHVYPERLSLGMSRRVAIIRAFAIDPDLLLMDEPFVSLDAPTARQARELLTDLWRQRPHTVLFVTHDLREAITLADRIVFLTSAPMRVFSELAIPIPRDKRNDEAVVESYRNQLIELYPDLRTVF
jgi:ABC-type nitrate/sulfonate/bicarbonate transport system ATPase subunit